MAEAHTVHSVDRRLGGTRLAGLVTDLAGARPGYRALAQAVRTLLLDGRVPLHTRLPAERELATALGVSRATVTAAYDLLRDGGFARSRRGASTWTELPEGRRPASVAAFPVGDGVIDLAVAAPPAPAAELSAALAAAAARLPEHAPTAGYHPYGLPELRAAVADRFTRRGLPTLPDQILITTGAQHAISLALALLGRPGDRALVENPSYPNALDAIRRAGMRATPVPVTDAGWDTALVESTLRQAAPRIAYLVPDFQNPTGALMGREQRVRILETARATGTWLLVDETIADIALDVPPPAPFASLAPHGVAEQVVTVGSLSKSHWGGLRIGWVRAGSRLITELAMARVPSDMATPVIEQLVALHLLEGMDEVLRARITSLRASREALAAALTRHVPEWRWQLPPGGLSLWVDLGAPVASGLARAALARGVRIEGGSRFGADPGTHEHRLRIPYTLPPDQCELAATRLAAALSSDLAAPAGAPLPGDWVA
ncbi:PLP-dependent aminotransferase family protein [Streptomyces spectabilis]|uniref:DNA-binding transcriptional MocR family regulator n=1 Tax=Streptomyces spectabilis TaxID=68270 RepID=A0A5P2XHT8_STRST|nr:PLP-dependent aminotransferase family protein [Streptomyces spectabilis]MBB5109289.1 DNA-binding transcriptional MocR family regulator [Streptomyces spectabilis]MCI3905973.1 PLP-dependent aminotransferase family protein [Streptomyces spectabilis]QEV62879.1 PLP-dependent aminotransferase family protein [Streptomyces spectabilis]GGV05607.1 GntR family transcriptional regulator [Streptomyces spectabilis]